MNKLTAVATSFSLLLAWASGARAEADGSAEVKIESIAALSDQTQRSGVTVSGPDGVVIASGSVDLAAAFPVRAGRLGTAQWKLSGDRISGVVTSEVGAEMASFEGSFNRGVLEGTFTTRQGATGSWRWEDGG